MQHDIWKFTGLLIAAGVFGYSVGYILPAILLMAIGIIAWQIYRLHHLQKWVENPIENPMPEMSGQFYQLHRDLSRKNAKSNKRKRQLSTFLAQFRKAIDALPDAIVLITQNGKIEWANPNAKEVLGIRWPEDADVRFTDLIRYPEVDKMLNDRHTNTDGVMFNSLFDADQTINIKCVAYTKELRMVIARDVSRLIKVNQIHRDFVANVSHELKTPLTVLRGYIEILQNIKGAPDQFIKPLHQMNLQSTRMQLIVNDLLYLAKLEDHSGEQNQEQVDVTNVVNTIIEAVQPLIEEKHHKLELDIDYSLKMLGAQTELHSAFANLITNAVHYTPNNGLIKIHWKIAQDGRAVFSVKDNGFGISARHLDRLTQRFYRVDTDRSRESGGTGLGLAIVKHVLQRHNAELEIQSTEGVGSEFKCLFPATQLLKQADSNAHQDTA